MSFSLTSLSFLSFPCRLLSAVPWSTSRVPPHASCKHAVLPPMAPNLLPMTNSPSHSPPLQVLFFPPLSSSLVLGAHAFMSMQHAVPAQPRQRHPPLRHAVDPLDGMPQRALPDLQSLHAVVEIPATVLVRNNTSSICNP
jgi:hypothetical protein